MNRLVKKFCRNKGGNFAVAAGVLAVPILFAMGGATDYTLLHKQQSGLQQAVDSATLATIKELGLSSITASEANAIAKAHVYSNLGVSASSDLAANLTIAAVIGSDEKDVTVNASLMWKPLVLHHLNSSVLPLKVSATASRAGTENVCVIALDASEEDALSVTKDSSIQANDCAVYSNSSDSDGIVADSKSLLAASTTYSAGGYDGPLGSYNPEPVTDSPSIADPLISRAEPASGSCDKTNLYLSGGTATLYPGTYCGGLRVDDNTMVTLKPGTYIMKNGPLNIGGNATMRGEYVGFFFEGASSVFDFGVSTQISLSAPKSGSMAGILFFEERGATPDRVFRIRSKDAEKFEGTVYLPKGQLVVEKSSRVGQLSNWTAIIAKSIHIDSGPELVINSDYGASDIPVPEGIENGAIRLTK